MNRWAISAICLGAIVAALSFIYWIRSDDVYAIDGPATQAAVLKVIPIGSKIDFAKTTMEAKGFQCSMRYNKRYAGDDPAGGRHQINYPAADFLWCDSERPTSRILISKRWQVIFVVNDDTVASVAVVSRKHPRSGFVSLTLTTLVKWSSFALTDGWFLGRLSENQC
jgi:hypothetical protein